MIAVYVTQELRDLRVPHQSLKALVRTVCGRFGVCKASVGIAIVGDRSMRQLNRRFTGRRGSTDCLSFDLSEAGDCPDRKAVEIVVNADRALQEAGRRGHPVQAELALYVTHGLLHHLGFDDATPAQARRMHSMEDRILRDLGYGGVYGVRPVNPRAPRTRADRCAL